MSDHPRKPHTRRPKNVTRRRLIRRTLGIIFGVLALGLLAFVAVAAAKTPQWDPSALTGRESSIVYDMNGKEIAQLHAGVNRLVVKSQDIPPLVKQTFVAVEDKRFYSNFGLDFQRIISSAIADLRSGSAKEGASTITIQLARNAFIANPTQKTLTRKIQEAILALELEHRYTKDQILTFYLNKIYLGESAFGIRAAAQAYFGKGLKELTPPEIALLAGLPQAPSGYDPYMHPNAAKYRRNVVLGVMKSAGLISAAEYTKDLNAPFSFVEQVKKSHGQGVKKTGAGTGAAYPYPYFIDYVVSQLEHTYNLTAQQIFSGGLKIYTTVDPKIQAAAEKVYSDPANFPPSLPNSLIQSAMTVVDPSTGSIRAMIGGRDYTPMGLNRAWQTLRQPGSTIKPLVDYAPALEKGGFYPGTVLDDMPVTFNLGGGQTWTPTDFDTATVGWKGLITMRFALEDSVNVYAAKLLQLIGVDYGWQFAKERLGLPLTKADRVASLALGTARVSTLDMASAYGVFANNGIRVTPHAITKVLDSNGKPLVQPTIVTQRVMKETTAYLINNLLHSVVTNGTAYNGNIPGWYVCGKTGTTSLPASYGNKVGSPDAWFAGYTPRYSAVVWMGYDSDPDGHHYLHNVFGGSYPAEIWKKVMETALQGLKPEPTIPQPPGIVSGQIDTKSGLLPSSLTPPQFIKTEIAAAGNFPTQVSNVWVQKEVDAANPSYLAGPNTLNKITKVFLNLPDRDPSIPWPPDEAPYRPPTAYAPGSGAPGAAAGAPPSGNPGGNNPPGTSGPPGANAIPTPALAPPISYDGKSGQASVGLNLPPGSSQYSAFLYVQPPGQAAGETIPIQNPVEGNSTVQFPLASPKHAPPAGIYRIYAFLKDNTSGTEGPRSQPVSLRIRR
ncbi:penicillin-binding protein 1F [Peptococcaceae bacterium CEB3]|nr:penicillin-binding protein 1F [Peptococcaceae bacterium CEB3]